MGKTGPRSQSKWHKNHHWFLHVFPWESLLVLCRANGPFHATAFIIEGRGGCRGIRQLQRYPCWHRNTCQSYSLGGYSLLISSHKWRGRSDFGPIYRCPHVCVQPCTFTTPALKLTQDSSHRGMHGSIFGRGTRVHPKEQFLCNWQAQRSLEACDQMWQASIAFAHIEVQATNVSVHLACSKHITQLPKCVLLFLHFVFLRFFFIYASWWESDTFKKQYSRLHEHCLILSSPNRRLCCINPNLLS